VPHGERGVNCNGRVVCIGTGAEESADDSSLVRRSTCGVVKDGEESLRLDYDRERMCGGLRAGGSGTERAGEVEKGVFVGSHDG